MPKYQRLYKMQLNILRNLNLSWTF